MKKLALNLSKYLLIFVFAYPFLVVLFYLAGIRTNQIRFFKNESSDYTKERLLELESVKKLDLVFCGSSHAYRSFDTRIVKDYYKCFNAGTPSQTAEITRLLFPLYIQPHHPEIVVYEVYPPSITQSSPESFIDIISNCSSHMMKKIVLSKHSYNTTELNAVILRFFSELFSSDKTDESILDPNDYYIEGGFVSNSTVSENVLDISRRKFDLTSPGVDNFKETVELMKNLNIRVILVFAPVPKATYDSYVNVEELDSLYSTLAEYYNLNLLLELNDSSHFIDDDHLNSAGAAVVTKYLLKEVL